MPGCRYGLLRMISAKCRLVQESTRSTDKKRPNTIPVLALYYSITLNINKLNTKNTMLWVKKHSETCTKIQILAFFFVFIGAIFVVFSPVKIVKMSL